MRNHLPLPKIDQVELAEFCSPSADRYEVLIKTLKRRSIPYDVIPLEKSRHILLPAQYRHKEYYRITFVAHYDRVMGSPGANDNAAAVFQLLSHWEQMHSSGENHHSQIIFTDHEEITGTMPVTEQGSLQLAKHLKRLGIDNILFFVLDMCGIGDTPVWSQNIRKIGLYRKNNSISRNLARMENLLLRYSHGMNYGINPLFSDDLGLLLGGYPALQLSLLPRDEALILMKKVLKNREKHNHHTQEQFRKEQEKNLPESWKMHHGPKDDVASLEERSFHLMQRILWDISRYRFPIS